MSATDDLRAMKPGETKVFSGYDRPSQLSGYINRLKEYGYRFVTRSSPEGVIVHRLPRENKTDIADLL